MPSLTNMECVSLIVIALVAVVPSLIVAWLASRFLTRLSTENRTLIAALLGSSDKPAAALLARQIEAATGEQMAAEVERKGSPVPTRRPHIGAS